jgi:hypothetical protein
MTPTKWNTPLITIGAALIGAGAACFRITGEWFSSPAAVAPHILYISGVAVLFGGVCGIASAFMNRWAR